MYVIKSSFYFLCLLNASVRHLKMKAVLQLNVKYNCYESNTCTLLVVIKTGHFKLE